MSVKFIQKFIRCKDIPINNIMSNIDDINTIFALYKKIFEIKSYKKLLNIKNIKETQYKNYSYKILKDNVTGAWFLTSKDLVILTITDKEYDKIESYLSENTEYIFCVYKVLNAYILICVSHTVDEIKNLTSFLYDHHCIYSHILLSKIIDSFVVLNDSFMDTCVSANDNFEECKIFSKIKINYKKLLGKGIINQDLIDLSNIISSIKNNYNFLPKHFLLI